MNSFENIPILDYYLNVISFLISFYDIQYSNINYIALFTLPCSV